MPGARPYFVAIRDKFQLTSMHISKEREKSFKYFILHHLHKAIYKTVGYILK